MQRIKLTRNKYALVDDADFGSLNKQRWFALSCGGKYFYAAYSQNYIKNNKKTCKSVMMHKIIMNPDNGLVVDHIDGDPLNNQRSNLRICTAAQNSRNRRKIKKGVSKYKGVVWNKVRKVWQVGFRYENKRMTRGSFKSEDEAALFYNELAKKYHVEFASLNIIK